MHSLNILKTFAEENSFSESYVITGLEKLVDAFLAVGLGFWHLRVRSVFLYHLRSLPKDVYFKNYFTKLTT